MRILGINILTDKQLYDIVNKHRENWQSDFDKCYNERYNDYVRKLNFYEIIETINRNEIKYNILEKLNQLDTWDKDLKEDIIKLVEEL